MTRSKALTIVVGCISTLTVFSPAFAMAANVAVNTQILIPNGSATCPSPTISSVTPYVYNNALDSFDLTVSDGSYVSVLGSAGNTGIRLAYMSRRMNADKSVTIHVDLPSVPINGTLSVSLTMLSSPSAQPTCITVVTFPVAGKVRPVSSTTTRPMISASGSSASSTVNNASGVSGPGTVASSAPPVVGGGVQNVLSRLCTAAGPYQLWFILLALFMVGIGLVAFAEPPLTRKSMELPAALILVPLVLLLLFWYVTPACRVAIWIPAVLLIAAAVALIAAYRENAAVGKIIHAPAAKPQPAVAKVAVPMKQTQTTTIITPTRAQQVTTTVTPNKFEQTKTIITPAPKNVPPQSPQKK